MRNLALLLLLLPSCRMPNVIGAGPGYSVDQWHGAGRDSETLGFYVTGYWFVGDTHVAITRLSELSVNRFGELALETHDDGEAVTVNVEGTTVEGDEAEEPEKTLVDKIIEKPKKGEELEWLLWVAGICILGVMFLLCKQAGLFKKDSDA